MTTEKHGKHGKSENMENDSRFTIHSLFAYNRREFTI
jgi:hypothetical protein